MNDTVSGKENEPRDETRDVTALLAAWTDGDQEAGDKLMPLVYDELRTLAAHHLRRERADHTLEPTALVHEAFLRLVNQDGRQWRCRGHFFSLASKMMRRILVDYSRHRGSARRGGNPVVLPLDSVEIPAAGRDFDLLALDEALNQLAELDLEKAELVEMRFFGGLTVEELATLRRSSVATVHRQLRSARAWLHRQLSGGRPQPEA